MIETRIPMTAFEPSENAMSRSCPRDVPFRDVEATTATSVPYLVRPPMPQITGLVTLVM